MKTLRTPPERRSKLEQHFRDKAAEYWRLYRPDKQKAKEITWHWYGKFFAFCHAAEIVSLDQEVKETIDQYYE